MNCEHYEELISALIDHEIDDAHAAEVFQHLGVCSSCRAFLTAAQRLHSVLAEHSVTVPSRLDARISMMSQTQRQEQKTPTIQRIVSSWKRRVAVPAPAFALLLFLLLAGAAVIIGLSRTSSGQTAAENTPVVYIMSLSPIEVEAQRIHETPRVQ